MKAFKFGGMLFLIWGVYFIIYNSFYGWNELPINDTERAFDTISMWLLIVAWGTYLWPLINIYERAVRKHYGKQES